MIVEKNGGQEAFRISRRRFLGMAGSALLLGGCGGCGALSFSSESDTISSGPVALGAYIPGVKSDPEKIDEFTNTVGTPPAIVMWFEGWASDESGFDPAKMDAAASRGAMPMVTWEPWDYRENKRQRKYSLRRIIAGKHDSYVRQWARGAARWGGPMYLRFAHEMNGDWYSWSVGANDNTSAEYVAAWRHMVDIFRREGATNVRWVWSPVAGSNKSTSFQELYPGDDYVDWIGLSGHNYGTSQTGGGGWRTLAEMLGSSYDELTTLAPDKPFMIPEVSSAEEGGDKAAWIQDAFFVDIPVRLPKTKAVVWFHRHKLADWRVDSSPSSLAAYSEAATSPAYQGWLP